MTVINNELIAETTVRFPTESGYWVDNVVVRLKTYETGKQYYYIDYVWYAVFDGMALAYKTWEEVVEMNVQSDADRVVGETALDQESAAALMKNAHPFYSNGRELDDGYDGEIIAQNDLTDVLVKYLVMDDDELTKYSGGTTAPHYRRVVIRNINNLWD